MRRYLEGLTYEQIEERYPVVMKARSKNKYFYRYPRGESYRDVSSKPAVFVACRRLPAPKVLYELCFLDDCSGMVVSLQVVERLEPMILEVEREENVLIIAHQGVRTSIDLAYSNPFGVVRNLRSTRTP